MSAWQKEGSHIQLQSGYFAIWMDDKTEHVNVGGAFKKIVQNMVNQDHNLMQPHQRDAIAHGWQAPYEKVQTLMRGALVTDTMGQNAGRVLVAYGIA